MLFSSSLFHLSTVQDSTVQQLTRERGEAEHYETKGLVREDVWHSHGSGSK